MILQLWDLAQGKKERLTKCYNGQRNGWYEERDCGYVNETSGSIKADDLSST